MSNYFEAISEIEDEIIIANARGGKKLNLEQIVEELNGLETARKRKNREITKYKVIEEKYQRIISGLMAYLELKINNDLWWDWNE